jgi:lipoate---protein ligase
VEKHYTIIRSTSRKPSFNLAAEEYLFSQRQEDIIFFYINNPCVVIGNNQAIHIEANLEYCRQNNIIVMRRISGGGAVYHDNGNLNFCIIRNREENKFPLGLDFLKPIVGLLNGMGIPVVTGKRKDLWLGDYKISGSAAHIGKLRAMHHGTFLYDTNLEHLKRALGAESPDCLPESLCYMEKDQSGKSISSVPSPVMNVREYLKNSGRETLQSTEFFNLVLQKFVTANGLLIPSNLTTEEEAAISEIEKNVYEKYSWIYKK